MKEPGAEATTLGVEIWRTSDGLWTTEDVARYLSVAPKTVRKWQLGGRLPFVKLGGLVRYVPEDVRQWVGAQRVEPRPVAPGPSLASLPCGPSGRRRPGRRPKRSG